MNQLATHLGSIQTEVLVIFVAILLAGLLAYSLWARPPLLEAQRDLDALANALAESEDVVEARADVADLLKLHPALHAPWEATQGRVLLLEHQGKVRATLLSSIDDIWSVEKLLQKRLNLAMFEAIPNIFVGVGLFFTFLFLTLALTDATAALTGSSANPLDATRSLLSSAGGKFLSSLAGLFVSLSWTIEGRRWMIRLDRASAQVVDAIQKIWPPRGTEDVVSQQLLLLAKTNDTLAAQQDTQIEALTVSQDQLSLHEELLVEAREQTGSLKRFETDLAVTIGKAITSSFAPQMEQMTHRLELAITNLSDRIGTMNEEALRKMMDDFSRLIRENTDSEMKAFKEALVTLSGQLTNAGDGLKRGVDDAAKGLGEAADSVTANVGEAARKLAESINDMEGAMIHAEKTVRTLDGVIHKASELGEQGMGRVDAVLSRTDAVVQRMHDSGESWLQVSGELQKVTASLTETCDAVEELAQEQRGVVTSVSQAVPQAMSMITRTGEMLDGVLRGTVQSTGQISAAMDKTTSNLSSVVTSITEGVTQYTQQVASLHQSMDAEMAKAIGLLGGAVQSLDDSISELSESLDEVNRRG